ncbi:hypothetical protein, partial [Escherichia fergusonii]|uniref:hypothetical protein n=1 Tax=Escherichia fergusonii TaxID=564 RepID=UPI001C5CB29A
ILFETNQLVVDSVETFVRLGKKLTQQIVHESSLRANGHATHVSRNAVSFDAKRLILVEHLEKNALNKTL